MNRIPHNILAMLRFMLVTAGAILCLCPSGCIAFYSHYPVQVTVRDAETQAPIAGASVSVGYRYVMVLNAPKPVSAVTDQQGVATLRAANFSLQDWQASTSGYLRDDQLRAGKPPRMMAINLYREPRPRVTIIVPNGYHGPVKMELLPLSEKVQDQIGKREFTFRASSTGYVPIRITPLLLPWDEIAISAAYEDGRSISKADNFTGALDIAFRWVFCEGNRQLLFVGTKPEADTLQSMIITPVKGDPDDFTYNPKAIQALFEQRP